MFVHKVEERIPSPLLVLGAILATTLILCMVTPYYIYAGAFVRIGVIAMQPERSVHLAST